MLIDGTHDIKAFLARSPSIAEILAFIDEAAQLEVKKRKATQGK